MTARARYWLGGLVLALLANLLGCSGVIMESKREDGGVERVKIDGENWSSYDDKPRYHQQKTKPLEDMSIVIKKEATF